MTTVNNTTNTPATNSTATGSSTGLNADFDDVPEAAHHADAEPGSARSRWTRRNTPSSWCNIRRSSSRSSQTSTLKDILSTLGTQNLTQASSLIGHAVEADSNVAGLTASVPAQWNWTTPREATTVVATISDASGKVVDTRTVSVTGSTGTLGWDGETSSGRQMEAGKYSLSIKALDSSGTELTSSVRSIGTVSDVQLDNGAILVTVNGNQFDAGKLTRIGSGA
jgi:flagellar basal-body rod modification protein FlgD